MNTGVSRMMARTTEILRQVELRYAHVFGHVPLPVLQPQEEGGDAKPEVPSIWLRSARHRHILQEPPAQPGGVEDPGLIRGGRVEQLLDGLTKPRGHPPDLRDGESEL